MNKDYGIQIGDIRSDEWIQRQCLYYRTSPISVLDTLMYSFKYVKGLPREFDDTFLENLFHKNLEIFSDTVSVTVCIPRHIFNIEGLPKSHKAAIRHMILRYLESTPSTPSEGKEMRELFNELSCGGKFTNYAGVVYFTEDRYLNSDGEFCYENGKPVTYEDQESECPNSD
jgi:hypothetical protein